MANAIYDEYKEALMDALANVDLVAGTVKATLIDAADYTFSQTHDFIDDVPAAARVATATLANKSVANGVFDADDVTFSAVTGDQCEAILIWIDTATESTSRLVAYLDTGITGLPVTPNGGDIIVQWDAGANKIFKL